MKNKLLNSISVVLLWVSVVLSFYGYQVLIDGDPMYHWLYQKIAAWHICAILFVTSILIFRPKIGWHVYNVYFVFTVLVYVIIINYKVGLYGALNFVIYSVVFYMLCVKNGYIIFCRGEK
ncbi:hypothetical protein SAMN02745866_02714 [Alteromonadaceae bacterium Bs31]|nr:hypothetical protein SAMN02745866_02714 [Alteromonadaceae bacterium Bs31]